MKNPVRLSDKELVDEFSSICVTVGGSIATATESHATVGRSLNGRIRKDVARQKKLRDELLRRLGT